MNAATCEECVARLKSQLYLLNSTHTSWQSFLELKLNNKHSLKIKGPTSASNYPLRLLFTCLIAKLNKTES